MIKIFQALEHNLYRLNSFTRKYEATKLPVSVCLTAAEQVILFFKSCSVLCSVNVPEVGSDPVILKP